jgi:hypothetical protein
MEPGPGRSAPHVSSSEHIRPPLIETLEQPIVGGKLVKAVFSYFKISKILQDSLSHRIFGQMHRVLNVGKKITNCTVCL